MKQIVAVLLAISSIGFAPQKQIPRQLWGSWRVTRGIPTSTVSCWGKAEATAILGSKIEYTAELFQWKTVAVRDPVANVRIITAAQFHEQNSGGGASDSQIDLHQLGIETKTATQVEIDHPPADLTGATGEIPGDRVLVKNRNTVIFSVCNVYFEAKRVNRKTTQR